MTAMNTKIFDPLILGNYKLENRIIMAPMTRGRAQENGTPNSLMADYYAARATAGLIITEATAISPNGYGWVCSPGIWSQEQIAGWEKVTKAVHAQGGHIFMQLWHMGRVSHPDFLNNQLPIAPSAIAAKGDSRTPLGKKSFVTPKEMNLDEISQTIKEFTQSAKNAILCGMDGVELHAANGYLIDQFIRDGSNQRRDNYGGSIDNRLRFLIEVTTSICNAIGSKKVGVRLSPVGDYNDMRDSNPLSTFSRAAELLNPLNLAYLHTMEPLPNPEITSKLRGIYKGLLITNGGYTKESAIDSIAKGNADAIAFGLPFIANPDLVQRFLEDAPLNAVDFSTLYTQGPKGYTDYHRMGN